MELNTRGRYAVMAMVDLAKFGDHGPVALASIADRQLISSAYLEQIFQRLRQAGLVESLRGRTGGYRLARSGAEISIASILQAVDEGVEMTRCAGESGMGCVRHERCLTHGLWEALGQQISGFLAAVSINDVLSGTGPLAPAALPTDAPTDAPIDALGADAGNCPSREPRQAKSDDRFGLAAE